MSQAILSSNLTTKAKVKAFVGIPSATTTYDDLIDMLINNTSQFIEGYCGNRRFLNQTYTHEIYDAENNRGTKGGSCIFLHQFPITALTTLEYRSGTILNPSWVVYDPNSYITYLKPGFVRFYAILPRISQGLRFTYTAGYLIDFTHEDDPTKHTLPFDLTMTATEMVARKYQLRQAQGIKSESVEGESVTFADDKPTSDQLSVLKKYTVARMAI